MRKNTEKINNEKLLGRKRISEEEYDYDKEIYNDIDFYNFLLKEFLLNNEKDIENDKLDSENRYDLTMKYILNRKAKMKKNVDTNAKIGKLDMINMKKLLILWYLKLIIKNLLEEILLLIHFLVCIKKLKIIMKMIEKIIILMILI